MFKLQRNKNKRDILLFIAQLLGYLLLSIIITSFFKSVALIEYDTLGYDQSCFYTIGKGICIGKIPYLDFYDNKGLLAYWLYSIISYIGDFRKAIFICQTLIVFFILMITKAYAKQLHLKRIIVLQVLFFIIYNVICVDAGMYTEDISLPFILLSIVESLLILKKYTKADDKSIIKNYFVISISFWIVLATRINCALPISGMLFCLGLIMLFNKRFKDFWKLILIFIVCGIIICSPIVIWLYSKGALYECIYQSFLVNFSYNKVNDALSFSDIFLNINQFSIVFYLLLIISVICILYQIVKNWNDKPIKYFCFVMFFALVFSVISISVITNAYYHHLSSFAGISIYTMFLFLYNISSEKSLINVKFQRIFKSIISIMLALLVFTYTTSLVTFENQIKDINVKSVISSYLNHFNSSPSEMRTELEQIGEMIPQEDRNSVFEIDSDPRFYVYTNIQPCKRIFVCRHTFTQANDDLHKEFLSYFQDDPPKWLIISLKTYEDNEIMSIINEKYQHQYSSKNYGDDQNYNLYKLAK